MSLDYYSTPSQFAECRSIVNKIFDMAKLRARAVAIEFENNRSQREFWSGWLVTTLGDLQPVYRCCQLELTCLRFPSKQCSYCKACLESFGLDFQLRIFVSVECLMISVSGHYSKTFHSKCFVFHNLLLGAFDKQLSVAVSYDHVFSPR